MRQKARNISVAIAFILASALTAQAARIKDIAHIEGLGGSQVIGYGLVTGLNNTGDNQNTSFTVQSITNMLKRFGITAPQRNPRVRNVAAVMVTATVPPFAKKGSKIDVQVSSMGDASSLQGGILLMTPLSTSDGTIVGMAQGAVSVGGYDARSLGSRISKNVATTGRTPSGLILEKNMDQAVANSGELRISLREPDFTTATRIAEAIGNAGGSPAEAMDAGSVVIKLPAGQSPAKTVQLIAQIEALEVETDAVARVVINERTGTIVVGSNVRLQPATIAHSGLEITIQKQVIVPQPAPFTIRPPMPVETAEITATEEMNPATAFTVAGATVQDIANALNSLRVKPRDLIAIFQALKEAGALEGELVIQ